MNRAISQLSSIKKNYTSVYFIMTLTASLVLGAGHLIILENFNVYAIIIFACTILFFILSISEYKYRKEHNEAIERMISAIQTDKKKGLEVIEGYLLYLNNEITRQNQTFKPISMKSSYIRLKKINDMRETLGVIQNSKTILENDIKGIY